MPLSVLGALGSCVALDRILFGFICSFTTSCNSRSSMQRRTWHRGTNSMETSCHYNKSKSFSNVEQGGGLRGWAQNALCLQAEQGFRIFTSAFNAPDKIIMLLSIQLLLIWRPFFLTANQELQPAESIVMPQTP